MTDEEQRIQQIVEQHFAALVARNPQLPIPPPPPASPIEITIRVGFAGTTRVETSSWPVPPIPCGCGPCGPHCEDDAVSLIQSLAIPCGLPPTCPFPDDDLAESVEKIIQAILGATGISRNQLYRRLLARLLAPEIEKFAADLGMTTSEQGKSTQPGGGTT